MQIAEVSTHLTSGMFGHFTQTNDPLLSILVHASAGKSMLGGRSGAISLCRTSRRVVLIMRPRLLN